LPEIVGGRLRRLADLVELGVSEPNRQRHGDAGCSGGGEGGVAMARLTSRRAFEAASNANHRPSGVSLAQLWRRSVSRGGSLENSTFFREGRGAE
jgi:hypothetical protein